MGALEAHVGRPPRATLANVRTGESRKFQFNPDGWEESIGAEYARLTVPGLSHQVMQFVNTRNRELRLELLYDSGNYQASSRGRNPILATRRWLRSLVHPRSGGGRITGGAPRVLFTWPSFVALTAFVTDARFTYLQINQRGEPSSMRVELTLEEVRDEIRLMEDVPDLEGE